MLLNFFSYSWWTPSRIQSMVLSASLHCLSPIPRCSWEPVCLIVSSTNALRSSALYFWQNVLLCCAILFFACPYFLNRIQHLLHSPHTFWLQHSSVAFGIAHIKSVMSQIIQEVLHLYYLKLNSLYPLILQLISPLCGVTGFL